MIIFFQISKRSVLTFNYDNPNTEESTKKRSDLLDYFDFNSDFQRFRSKYLHLFDDLRYPLQLPPKINVHFLHNDG